MYSSSQFHLPSFPITPLMTLSLRSPVTFTLPNPVDTFHFFSWISQLYLTLNPSHPWVTSSKWLLLIITYMLASSKCFSPLCWWDSCLPIGISNSKCAKSNSSSHLHSVYFYFCVPNVSQWPCLPPAHPETWVSYRTLLITLLSLCPIPSTEHPLT